MNLNILKMLLIITSLLGYLEWGKSNNAFLIQIEIDIFKKMFFTPSAVLHPLIILPILGQISIIYTIFKPQTKKIILISGVLSIALLYLFLFIIGCASLNFKILISSIPYLLITSGTLFELKKTKIQA